MRHLRMLGLMLLAAVSLGSFAASTASASEPGALPLEAAAVTVTSEKSTGSVVFKAGTNSIACTSLDETTATAASATHVRLFNEVVLTYLGCKEGELNCRSETLKAEKDAPGTVLVLADLHLVALLNGTTLEPGVAVIRLDQNTKEIGTVKVVCGTAIVEIKGVLKGKSKVASLSADIESGTYVFPGEPEPKCDTSDELCEQLAKEPFLAKFSKVFETATLKVEVPFKVSPMVLVDD
jgi:hypothetical protein